MRFFTVCSKQFIIFLFTICLIGVDKIYAQVSSASIEQGSSNRLVVNLSSRTTLSNSDGWYLVGGGAEVKRLIGGSGTNTLTFELTDYILPDDNFTLYYYEELGNAVSNGAKTRSVQKMAVNTSSVNSYQGNGRIYYVSRYGSSGSAGTSPSQPTTFSSAISKATAGDYVLLKKGETYSSLDIKNKRGTADRYITIGSYGGGSMPVISSSGVSVEVRDSHYVQVVGLEARNSQVRMIGDSRYCKFRSLKVIGEQRYSDGTGLGIGISYSSQSGSGQFPYHSTVMHCEVSRFRDGIYGYQIKGGGKICFNDVSYCSVDGIRAFNGNTGGIIIGHNEITKFSDDGIDLFNGSDIIVQYNKIHDPVPPHSSGANNGIKGGGISGSSVSSDITIRYNTVYNLPQRGSFTPNAITTNGAISGEIYGNLCYNIDDNAIEITARVRNKAWKVYNNTAISNRASGLIVAPDNPDVTAYNNIFQGPNGDVRVNGSSSRVVGRNNILVNNSKVGNYSSSGDFSASVSSLFVSYGRDFQLRSSSPAINKGVSISGYIRDIIGKSVSGAPAIGCFEYGGQEEENPSNPEPEPTPSPTPDSPVSSTSGLHYKYYQGTWNSIPNFNSQSVVKQGTVSNFSLAPRTRNDNFGMVFEGQIQIDRAGQYTFFTSSDDGTKLYVKGQQVVNNDGLHAKRERSGSIYLAAGLHPIKVEYFERTGKEILEVRYQGAGVSKQLIPSSKLFLPSNNQRINNSNKKGEYIASDEVESELFEQASPIVENFAYPNPIQDELNIELATSAESLEIKFINMLGSVVWQNTLSEVYNTLTLDLTQANIPTGYYLVVISSQDGILYKDKMLKE